ncbi:MAG: phosphoribosylglycinamide formyltransferase [Ignavibacteriae bacterium]|nr:phosphoribosylglycinamide formyltransferase [Ignavibacteriota bacterium]
MNICIFASGSGTNFKAIIEAKKSGIINSEVSLLVTNNSDCGAVAIAKENNIPVFHISRKVYPDASDEEYANLFLDKFEVYKIDFIVLAGYMKMLDVRIIRKFPNRIINIHPALLPKFGGKGMYGMNVHRAVIEAGEKESGVSIHFVNENYDEGKIIFQERVIVEPNDDAETLQKKVLRLEHKYYAEVISKIENGEKH